MTSSIEADPALADTVHALTELQRRPRDLAFVCAQLAVVDAALSAFESALEQPLDDLTPPAHRAFLAALVVACALASFPANELASLRRTTARMLDLLEPLATPADRALRMRLSPHPVIADRPTSRA